MTHSETIDRAVTSTEANLRQGREANAAREQRIKAADQRRAERQARAEERKQKRGTVLRGVGAVAAVGLVAGAVGHSINSPTPEESAHEQSLRNIQHQTESQTADNELQRQLAEGKDPSEIVVPIPADVASGEK